MGHTVSTVRKMMRVVGAPGALGAAAILAVAIAVAWLEASWIAFNPQNGQFQNYNMFARLMAGQVPFVDFPAYLGAAALLVPFPIFAALGGDLAASSAAAALTSMLVLGASFAGLIRLCGVPWRWALPLAAFLSVFPWTMSRGSESALGLRSFLPFLAAAAIHGLVRAGNHSWRGFAALGTACGAMPLWSNDYGIPTAIATAVVGFIALFPGWRALPARLATFAAAAAVSFVAVASAVTAGSPMAWVEFNFGAVAKDQFWYFNPMVGTKVFSLTDLPIQPWPILLFGIAAALALRWLIAMRRDAASAALATIAIATSGAVLVSGIAGSFEPRYFGPLMRVGLVGAPFLAVLAARAAWRFARRGDQGGDAGRRSPLLTFAGDCSAVGIALVGCLIFQQLAVGQFWPTPAPGGIHVDELGGTVPGSYSGGIEIGRELRRTYDAEQLPPDRRLLSTYATAVSVAAGSLQAVPDYIIHALGERGRVRFAEALDEGYRNVETIDPSFIAWGKWNVRMSWDFYRKLFAEWEPTSRTPWSIVWSRRAAPRGPGERLACEARREPGGGWIVSVQPGVVDEPSYVDVSVSAESRLEPSGIPMIGSRGLVEVIEGPASASSTRNILALPEFGTAVMDVVERSWTMPLPDGAMRFPVRVEAGRVAEVTLRAWPPGRAEISVGGCEAAVAAPVRETELPRPVPRRARILLADGPIPDPAPFAKATSGEARFLRTSDGLGPSVLRIGQMVEFPGGARARVVAMTFGWLVVEEIPGERIPERADHVVGLAGEGGGD